MMNNKRASEYKTLLLKAQATFSGALNMYYTKNGVKLLPGDVTAVDSFKPKIFPYIATAQDCGKANCVSNTSGLYKTYNNNSLYLNYLDDGQFIMNDGMTVFIENYEGRLYFLVDINGFKKKPNKAGHDLFVFQINNKGDIVPMGAKGTNLYSATNEYCSETSTNKLNGYGCTAKALSDPNYFKNLH